MIYGLPKNFCNNIYTHILSNAQTLISLVYVCVRVYVYMTHVHVKVHSSLAFPSAGRTIGCTFGRYYIISGLLVNVNISLFVGRSFRNDNDNIMSHHRWWTVAIRFNILSQKQLYNIRHNNIVPFYCDFVSSPLLQTVT